MFRFLRWWRHAVAVLALGAATVGSVAAPSPVEGWRADPDEQLILDVNLRRYRLGDGVRAYPTPEGVCVLLGDVIATLDVPIRIDLAAKTAKGWAFRESNQIAIDLARREAQFAAAREPIAPGTVREVPEGWCVETVTLGRWLGIGTEASLRGSMLNLKSEQKLPVELAIERRARAAKIKPAAYDMAKLPQVRLPYRMWRTPALEFIVSSGATYSAATGLKLDRQASLYAAGEVATMSVDARVGTNPKGIPDRLRMRAYRSDHDGRLLGPLKATHFGLGDVEGFQTPLGGGGGEGRGLLVTNRPLSQASAFDRKDFTGELPVGWDAEIYRNGVLLGFARPGADQRYHFDDVQLLYGDNQFEIVMYGPQGQIRRREEQFNVGSEAVPPGKTWYWLGANQVGQDLINLSGDGGQGFDAGWQATAGIEHGVDTRTSVAALVETMVVDDQRLTFIEGSVRRSLGPALLEVSGAMAKGGYAARAQLIGRLGATHVSAESIVARNFHSARFRDGVASEHRLSVDTPVKLGRSRFPVHADVGLATLEDGSRTLEAGTRVSGFIKSVMLTGELEYRKPTQPRGRAPPPDVDARIFASGRFGDVRLRGGTNWSLSQKPHFDSAELSAYWSASDTVDWQGELAYEGRAERARARVTHVRRFSTMALALSAEAATDGSVAAGVNLSFALGPSRADGGGIRFANAKLASSGSVSARVFRDLNNDGVRDLNEPLEKSAVITAGMRLSDQAANRDGFATVDNLETFRPVAVGVDESSLSDPSLVPSQKLRLVTPRPGVPAQLDIPLIGGGDVEGVLVKSGGGGFEGLDIELIDPAGAVVQTARTDFEGYFLFERVAYGEYRLRIAKPSADAARVQQAIDRLVKVVPEASVVRLGVIPVDPARNTLSSL